MRKMTFTTILLAGAIAFAVAAPVSAKQYNQSRTLHSRFQVKVNKAIAEGNRLMSENGPTDTAATFGTCGNLNINSVDAPRPGQPPIREQITVVTGDVINVVNRGCR
ncbi:MAG: hypothetical protein KDK04_09270 [Candidatus Competibacteraceae bacterium]|nr:hypothetical protein [Candidatus Competibacteraceae bacterium]MCB1811892.1 hypothetical protein [Candidatus Competibacteraceae bacterium]